MSCTHHSNTFNYGISLLHCFEFHRGVDYPLQLAMIVFNDVIPVLNLSAFELRRRPTFVFEQSERTGIGGCLIRVDEPKDLPLLHIAEYFTQEPLCRLAIMTWGEVKIDSTAPVVNGR